MLRDLRRLADTRFDLLVIGAGISTAVKRVFMKNRAYGAAEVL